MDDTDYRQVSRSDINYSSGSKAAFTQLTETVSIVTKSYKNRYGASHAQLETFVCSSDPRVRSEHLPHLPYKLNLARIQHKHIANRVRAALGLALEEVLVPSVPDNKQGQTGY